MTLNYFYFFKSTGRVDEFLLVEYQNNAILCFGLFKTQSATFNCCLRINQAYEDKCNNVLGLLCQDGNTMINVCIFEHVQSHLLTSN